MSRFTKVDVFKRSGILAGTLLSVLAVGSYLQAVVHIDPFAGLKKTSKSVDPNLGVRLEDVSLKSFDHGKLVTKATIARMDIGQDRQQYEVFGVTNGVFYSKQGKLEFDAPRAVWNVAAHDLQAPLGGKIKTKDADLKVPQFAFNSKTGVFNTPGEVNGKLMKGDVSAKGLTYNVNSETFRTGPIAWKGKLAMGLQDAPQGKDRYWDIHGSRGMYTDPDNKDVIVYEGGYGTDGDIIIQADLVKQNRRTSIVTASGHVLYISRKANMTCENAVIDRKQKKATLTGNVEMLFKPKDRQQDISHDEQVPPYRPVVPEEIARSRPPAPGEKGLTPEQKKWIDEIRSTKNMRDYPTICYSEKVEYWYGEGNRHAIITGNPQALQQLDAERWRQVWTKTALYNGETDRLRLESSEPDGRETRMINSIGDDVKALWIEVSTLDGDDSMRTGAFEGRMVDFGDEIPRDKSNTGGSGAGKTVPPPKTGGQLKGEIGKGKS